MKMKKRLLSILLSLVLMLGLMPGMSLTAYAAEQKVTFTAEGTENGITVSPTTYYFEAFFVSNTGNKVSISSSNYNITKLVLTDKKLYSDRWGDSYLGASAGNVSFSGDTMTVTGINAKTVTIQGNNSGYATISSIDVYYDVPDEYSVTINPGSNMTKTDGSGAASQTGLSGAMTDVVYTADAGYCFPTDYSVAEVNGITVTRDSYTQITVSGTPTADAAIALTAPTAKTTPDAPTTATATDCTTADNNDGKLTGVTTAMEYKKSDADSWTAGTGSDITGLVPGTYYVRIKATDTTNESANQELTIAEYTALIYTVTYKVVGGTWSDDSTTDKTETVQSGSSPASVPTGMKASSGYTGGAWDTNPAEATITGTTTFTYTFTAKQPATVTKVPTAKTLTYNGSAQELVTAGTAESGEMQYALGTATEATQPYTTSIPAKTDAGTYYVWYKAKGDVNHNDSEAGCVSVTVYTPTYTVTYKVVGGTWSDDSTTDKTETVVSGSKPASAPTGMKASEGYTGGAWDTNPTETTITGATTFTYIFTSKSTATITKIPTAKSLTYTGSAQELVTAGEASGGTMQYALGTATEATEQYTTSIPTATDAGTYYVWYKAVGDANHNDSEAACVSVQIASKIEAKVTFKVVNGSWDDGTTEDKTVTLTGKQGDTLKLLADQIPTVGNKPNDTYKSGSWDVAPSTDTAITTATTYTYIYAQKDVAPQPQPEPQPQPQVTPSIAIDGGDFELIKGSTKNLTVKLVPEGTAVTYSSSNEEIAAVDSEGRVIANSVGTVVITAKITVEEKDYTSSVTVTVTEESTKESTIVSSELTDGNIPDEIKAQGLDTKEKVEQKLEEALSISSEQKENIAVRDVRLIIKENGVERAATAEDFPEDGLDVLLEYPEGTNKDDFIFNVAHMIAETVGGYQAGSVETPGCSNTDEGIRTKFHGLSPVLITWSKRDSSEPVEKKENHVHEFAWDTVAATEDQDGELRYQCKECGHILTRVPLSAYYVFNANAVEKITKAKQGETVKVTTDRWISFHKMVFDALAARPDVSLEVSFLDEEYKGNRVSFTIPAAADTSDLFTEDNFVGFMYLGNKYGLMAEEN